MSILWLLLIGWLAFFWNLGSTGLIDETEPLFAEAINDGYRRLITPFSMARLVLISPFDLLVDGDRLQLWV